MTRPRACHIGPGGVAPALLVGLTGALVAISCGGSQMPGYERIDQRKQEIAILWGQIRSWRQEAGLKGVEPKRVVIIEMNGKPMSSATRVCPEPIEPETSRCRDLCSLAGAICENAESICRIAGELIEDPWAHDKCSSAKASCKEAKQACCQCRAKELGSKLPHGQDRGRSSHRSSVPGVPGGMKVRLRGNQSFAWASCDG
ncbi:MAG: hypothetical protein MJE77_46125 [Proteobacteria bacterium]|nr:hypothetical protein [Pseudomonadota bacterium]